jgi:hypothetical protein
MSSTVWSKPVTHLGQTSTLYNLLTSKTIFTFIQHSQVGGCKIICQHDDPTIIHSKGKVETQHPHTWFTTNTIGVDKDLTEQPDWNTKTFTSWTQTILQRPANKTKRQWGNNGPSTGKCRRMTNQKSPNW